MFVKGDSVRSQRKKSALFFVLIVLCCVPSYATVQGYVTDSTQTPIQGALVTFTEEAHPDNSFSGYTDENGWYEIELGPTSVSEETPYPFTLCQNYPNPFNPVTTIPFFIDQAGHVTLTAYNIMGQKVATLFDQYLNAGQHNAVWNGMDNEGNHVGAGVYFYRLKAGQNVETRKMLLLDGGMVSGINGSAPHVGYSVWKTTSATYRVNITGEGIADYEERDKIIEDGGYYDFVVSRANNLLTFVPIPGGTFEMGDEIGDLYSSNRPVHTVTVSDFEMSITEVTKAQYAKYLTEALAADQITASNEKVIGKTGNNEGQEYIVFSFSDCGIRYIDGVFMVAPGKENYPVTYVTWYGAKAFAMFYGLDLPTEAEWEYACRGGQQYLYGTDDGTINSSNYDDNIGYPIKVCQYPANPFGLFDMCGNVVELCHDWHKEYANECTINPTGPQSNRYRIIRGGSCLADAKTCRSACRAIVSPLGFDDVRGFRVVRRPDGGIAPDIHRISGKVLFNGTGLQDVNVSFEDKSVNTDTDGTYSFNRLSDGTYTITFAKEGYEFSPDSVQVTVSCSDVMVDDVLAIETVVPVELTFVSIPGGTFSMGDIQDYNQKEDEKPVHDVTLSPFEMSVYEITNSQYVAYLNSAKAAKEITVNITDHVVTGAMGTYSGENYFYFDHGPWRSEIHFTNNRFIVEQGKENYPVYDMTWYGAKAYANYYGFDLPTEAEWEYACRAGTETLFYTGNDIDSDGFESSSLDLAGWYFQNSTTGFDEPWTQHPWTHQVGQKLKNAWGLYDMHGNVLEWCNDRYGVDYYELSPTTNPTGNDNDNRRVLRGGGWDWSSMDCRSAVRLRDVPSYGIYDCFGFRVVRRPGGLIY